MRFKPGDLAIIQHSRWAENNGKIVVVLAVDPLKQIGGVLVPYQVRRIDGVKLVQGRSQLTGRPTMRFPHDPWAAPRYLRPLPPLEQDGWSDWEAIQQLQMQRAMERSLASVVDRGEKD